MAEKFDALRFATVLRESGTDGNGGAPEGVAVAVAAALLFDPVSPARLLVFIVATSRMAATDRSRHWSHLRWSPMALAATVKTSFRMCLLRTFT
jgi:hypothetical protein